MEYDFAKELSGDEGEPMNVKGGDHIASIVVGVIVGGTVAILGPIINRDNSPTVAAIAKLETTVAQLTEQVKEFKGYPYVRREEFVAVQERTSGIEQRVSHIERTVIERRQR